MQDSKLLEVSRCFLLIYFNQVLSIQDSFSCLVGKKISPSALQSGLLVNQPFLRPVSCASSVLCHDRGTLKGRRVQLSILASCFPAMSPRDKGGRFQQAEVQAAPERNLRLAAKFHPRGNISPGVYNPVKKEGVGNEKLHPALNATTLLMNPLLLINRAKSCTYFPSLPCQG